MRHSERHAVLAGAEPVIASHSRRSVAPAEAEIHAQAQDSFSLIYMIDPLPAHESWSLDGHVHVPDLAAGSMHIMDLRAGGSARITSAFNSMNVTIPRSALDAVAEQIGCSAPAHLRLPREWVWRDPFVDALHLGIAQSIAPESGVDDLVYDHLVLALVMHVAVTYGNMRRPPACPRGGLTTAQLARAKEAITHSLDDGTSLAEIARRCDLSPSHFSRAFKLAAGKAPSAWRTERRVELAQRLLRDDAHSIAEIALLSGFADQSHLTRAFSRHTGISPGQWQRTLRRT